MIYAYKTTIGNGFYPEDGRHDNTHVVLKIREYEDLEAELKVARASIKEEERKGELKARDEQIKAAREYRELEKQMEQLKQQLSLTEKEYWKQKRLNDGFARIMRERNNAKRGLQPAKKRTGYRIVGDIKQFTIRYLSTPRRVWMVTLETPYSTDLDIGLVNNRILNDLIGLDGSEGILENENLKILGAENGRKFGEYDDLVENARAEQNVLYDVTFSANPKNKLWKATLYTTKPLTHMEL